jgi:FlaA1/EpsC-like NDP-sugar epimerase
MSPLQGLISNKKWLKIVIDAITIILGFLAALAIRFEFAIPSGYLKHFLPAIPVLLLLFLLTNSIMRIYSGHWKYASFDELISLASAAILSTAILLVAVLAIPGGRTYVPASVAVIGGVLSLFAMAFIRLQFRLFGERMLRRGERGSRKVLLIGAGEAGEMVARDMLRHPEYDYHPVGFVDDDPMKHNMVIRGVPVLGNRSDVPGIVKKHDIEEIFITIPSVTGEKIREILPYCEETGAEIKILPGIFLTMAGEVSVASVRELRLEDLLGREPVKTDVASISAYVTDRVVMVTGAGGSIGSELSRQLCCIGPRKLLLLDNDSTRLVELEMELGPRSAVCPVESVVADIRDEGRLEAVFRSYRPQVVFHSAALKHVPLMELHPCEAVKSNVTGTRNLAQLSGKYNVERFILISTDKAVHPANVMGATKRLAELLIKGSNGSDGTFFTSVRFGNVLGSRGSVVPIFRKQIEEGGPVLVTHPEVTRFFMTVEEAAQLVIQAGAYTEGGDIFILDMGEPVRIADLANEMVRLLGGGKDVEIRITGLRPGEKLHEKLVFQVEERLLTPHPKINRVVHDYELPPDFDAKVDSLIEAAVRDDVDDMKVKLSSLLPSYQPDTADREEAVELAAETKPKIRLVKDT